MGRKADLEELIREACKLIREYEQKMIFCDDPKAEAHCAREIKKQWALIDKWLPKYQHLCQQLRQRPAEDVQEIIVLREKGSEDPVQVIPLSETVSKAKIENVCDPKDVYSSYETGLRRLLGQLGKDHPRYSDALTYQQRLSENITQARLYSDAETSRAERSRIIEQLNALASSVLGISFNELCDLSPMPSDMPETVIISAGPFWMGSSPDVPEAHENEKPRRKVNVPAYEIGRYPVTNAQYACFVYQTDHSRPDHWEEGKVPTGLEDHPVVNINYDDAVAYCHWLGQVTGKHYRLPTEEEWEKAARGRLPEARRYPWGDEWQPGICNTRELGRNGTTSVHEFEEHNQSPFEAVDMAGNVWEWTASWYQKYPGSSHQGLHYGRHHRVIRGGSWRNSRREARIACRGRYKSDVRRPYLGFRIASD